MSDKELLPENFERYLLENSYRGVGELKLTDLHSVLHELGYERLSKGMNARTFTTKDRKWVVKEGRWDLDISFFKNLDLQVPASMMENFLSSFKLNFLPRQKVIIEQFKDYLIFAEYFGYFDDRYPAEGQFARLRDKQRAIRSHLDQLVRKLEQFYSYEISDDVLSKIEPVINSNLLPVEYLLYSKSISDENEGKDTYFIVQEFVEGTLFHDADELKAPKVVQSKLLLIAILVLIMAMVEDKVPDMRPRYLVGESRDWFGLTDNVIVNHSDVFYIDTRWLWDLKGNFVQRGLLIPEITLESAKRFINKLNPS